MTTGATGPAAATCASWSNTGPIGFDWRAQERAINRLAQFTHHDRRRRGSTSSTSAATGRADADPARPWLAVDVLGLSQGDRTADRSGEPRRRSGRCVRRRRAVAARLRVLDPADHAGHQLLAHRRPVGRADGRPRLSAVRGPGRRLGRAGRGPARPQVCRSAVRRPPPLLQSARPYRASRSSPPTTTTRPDLREHNRRLLARRQRLRRASRIPGRRRWPTRSTTRRSGCARGWSRSAAAWSDCGGDVERVFSKDELLTTVCAVLADPELRQLGALLLRGRPRSMAAVARPPAGRRGARPAVAVFPRDVCVMPRRWIERYYNLRATP